MAKTHVFLLFIFLLTACQPSASPAATPVSATATKPPPTATPIPVSNFDVGEEELEGIEVEVWHAWFGASAALFDLQIAEFNKENPWGIKVSAIYQGSYNLLFDKVITSLDTSEQPQIIVALADQIPVWRELGSVKNLTPYIDDPIWGFTTAEKTDIPSIFLAQDQHGDEQIALPAQRTARFLLYNKTWGEELGFDAPPLGFDEFEEQSCAANKSKRADENPENDGKGGWIVDVNSYSVLAWMRGFDGGTLNDEGNYQFINAENIDTLKGLKNLYDKQCTWLSTADTPYDQFAVRSALFISASMEEFPEISRSFAKSNSHDEWVVIPFPGEERGAVITYGTSYALLEADDVEALASWLFIKWMLTPENQAKWVKSTALFPLRISALEELSDYEKANPHWAEAVDLISQAENYPQLASWRKVRYLLGDGFEYIYRFDMQAGSVAAILAQMDTTAQALSE